MEDNEVVEQQQVVQDNIWELRKKLLGLDQPAVETAQIPESVTVTEQVVTKEEDDNTFELVSRKKKDLSICCRNCNKTFTFPKHKVDDFKKKGYAMPKSCRECLAKKKTMGSLNTNNRSPRVRVDLK